jgi:hypothetical protein
VPISKKTGAPDAGALLKRIADSKDALRKSLSSDLTTALPALLVEANKEGGTCYAALYELHDEELESYLVGNRRLHLILSNTIQHSIRCFNQRNTVAILQHFVTTATWCASRTSF